MRLHVQQLPLSLCVIELYVSDAMSDREYLFAFMKLSQEEKESLMISEAERRRTFAAHWPIWNFINGYDCAKEGFYYTGEAV